MSNQSHIISQIFKFHLVCLTHARLHSSKLRIFSSTTICCRRASKLKSVAVDKQKRQKFREKQARRPGKFRDLDWSGHATSKGTGTPGRSADETGLDLGSGGR